MSRPRLTALVAALGTVLVVLPTGTAIAAPGGALVRVAHFSPDAPEVDIYLDGREVLSDVGYRDVSDYLSIPAGDHEFEARPAGDADAEALASVTDSFTGKAAYTVLAAGSVDDLKAQVITDDFSLPPADRAKVRVIHTSPTTPTVDARTPAGDVLFEDVAYREATGYGAVPGGSYDVDMVRASTDEVLWSVKGVAVRAGSVYTLAAVGGLGQPLEILPLRDASGPGTAPSGGVATGAGGTATAGLPVVPGIAALTLLGVATLGAFAAARRRAHS